VSIKNGGYLDMGTAAGRVTQIIGVSGWRSIQFLKREQSLSSMTLLWHKRQHMLHVLFTRESNCS
jgi:hypothetical protein